MLKVDKYYLRLKEHFDKKSKENDPKQHTCANCGYWIINQHILPLEMKSDCVMLMNASNEEIKFYKCSRWHSGDRFDKYINRRMLEIRITNKSW